MQLVSLTFLIYGVFTELATLQQFKVSPGFSNFSPRLEDLSYPLGVDVFQTLDGNSCGFKQSITSKKLYQAAI